VSSIGRDSKEAVATPAASLVDESIIADFVAESRDHLNAIEPDLLTMEQGGAGVSKELLNRVFRAIHSIKGGAGFLAFEGLKGLSHSFENVLMLVRDGRLAVDPEVMDAVFAGLDRLRAMLDDIQASDRVPCESELERFRTILERQGVEQGAQVKARGQDSGGRSLEFDLDRESVHSALIHGMNLFHAGAFLHRDIKDKGMTPLAFLTNALSVGECLDAYIDLQAVAELDQCLEGDLQVTLLFGTVLEPDLAAMALGLPPAQVTMLDMQALRKRMKDGKAAEETAPAPPGPARASGTAGAAGARPGPAAAGGAPGADPPEEAAEGNGGGDPGASRAPRAGEGSETLRVRVDLLTSLMNQAGELVLSRNQLLRALAGHSKDIPGLAAILQNINQVTSELQEGIMQTRMQPIGTVFNRFPRIIRDMSRQLGKEIEIQIKGAEVELDKSIVELLADPLTHIIRNCADHAIELPEERRRLGKAPAGQLLLHAYHQGGQVIIAITDDGRGIDPGKVLAKALAKGLVKEAQAREMTDREIVNLVFAPGFSTAETVTEVSGRGVGMDVVRSNTEKLGGHVELESQVGVGTTVLLRLPLTLAIIPSMIVGVGGSRFAIPQVNVVEFVWVRAQDAARRIEKVHGAEVLRLRSRILPLVRLAGVLGLERTFSHPAYGGEPRPDRRQELADRRGAAPAEAGCEPGDPAERGPDRRTDWRSDYNIVVLKLGPNQFGVVVDELFDIEEIVVKPLSEFVQGSKCFSGATIMGDGRVIMILDAGGLAQQARLHFADVQAEERLRSEEEQRKAAAAASRRRAVLVCAGAPGEYFAIPQDRIMRLEKVRTADIQRVGDRAFVDYRGRGLPLLRLDELMEVRPLPADLKEVFVVIPKASDRTGTQARAGIVISDIIDALDVEVELEPVKVRGAGLLGGAILQGHLTLFLEPLELLRAAGLPEGGAIPAGQGANGARPKEARA
jgi:two-component system chemotaxis sensor kinase CheA